MAKKRNGKTSSVPRAEVHLQYGDVCLESIIKQRIRDTGLLDLPAGYEISWIAKIAILCFLITNLTQTIELFRAKGDQKKLFACFSVLSFCFMGFLKLWSLLTKQAYWRSLITKASSLENKQLNYNYYGLAVDYESDDEEHNSYSVHISSYTKKFYTISTYLSRIYCFTAIIFMASPFIEYGLYKYQGRVIDELPHILPGWAPLDINIFGYCSTILAEAIAAVYCVRVHTAFDLTAVGLMIFIRGQFLLLHDYSQYIGGKGKTCVLSNKRDNRAHYRIQECHYIHVLLLKSVNDLSNLIRNILGIYFFVATLTLCSVAVQLKSEQLSAAQLISLVQYMGATLTQLYLFCHYGDAVINESSIILGQGPYCAASWCLSSKIRREIAILCVGMSRPCRMRAGPFNSLDLPSFIQISQTWVQTAVKEYCEPTSEPLFSIAQQWHNNTVVTIFNLYIVRTAYSYYAILRQTSE